MLSAAYLRNREYLAPWEPIRSEKFFTEQFQRQDIVHRLKAVQGDEGFPLALVLRLRDLGAFHSHWHQPWPVSKRGPRLLDR